MKRALNKSFHSLSELQTQHYIVVAITHWKPCFTLQQRKTFTENW